MWYPFAVRRPGVFANYGGGAERNRMEVVKCHYTVGYNSLGTLGRDFQFLVSRDGTVYQGAPVDAICWDSGEWNDAGPGVEIEHMPATEGDIFTPEAREATRGLCQWLISEHGFPAVHWDGDRISEYGGFRGFIDHCDLIQTQQHNDYWPADDVAYILGNGAGGLDNMDLAQIDAWMNQQTERITGKNLDGTYVRNLQVVGDIAEVRKSLAAIDAKITKLALPQVDVKALAAQIAAALPPDAPADARAIATAVRDEFAARPLR
jgi:hypothetical protein